MEFSATEAAGHLHSNVFPGKPQFLFAMRALGINVTLVDIWAGGVETKVDAAKLTLDSLTQVLAMDFEFLCTLRATHKQAGWYDLNHRVKLLKWNENGNLDAVHFEIRVQQLATGAAVNHGRRHFIAALWTRATGPGRHLITFKKV